VIKYNYFCDIPSGKHRPRQVIAVSHQEQSKGRDLIAMTGDELYGSVYKRGTTVFREGEQGHSMYIIQSGAVEVTRSVEDREIVLAQLEQGDFFGEMALIDDRTRSATVRTLCRSRLLPITKKSLLARIPRDPGSVLHILRALSRRIVGSNSLRARETEGSDTLSGSRAHMRNTRKKSQRKADKSHPAHVHAGTYESIFITLSHQEHSYFDAGEIIFTQGDKGDEMYIITEGAVEIDISDNKGPALISTLGPGDFFGEIALFYDGTRSANAVACEKTTAVKIRRQPFLDMLKTEPQLAISIIQLMILRLRNTIDSLSPLDKRTHSAGIMFHPLLKKDRRINLSLLSLSACSGCIINILEERRELDMIREMTNITCSPMLMDSYEVGHTDIAVIDGAVRNREERELLEEVRSKSRYIVAWGTCAAFTGVPAFANSFELEDLIDESYGHAEDPYAHYLSGQSGTSRNTYRDEDLALLRKAGKLDDYVKVDYFLPGCPPRINLLTDLIKELRGEKTSVSNHRIVCSECSRIRTKCSADSLHIFSARGSETNLCFNSQGIVCLGFFSRGKCGAPCPDGGLPCWGCRGPSDAVLNEMKKGNSFENILAGSIQRTCRLSPEKIAPQLNALGSQCLSVSKFDHYFIHDYLRIR
jgi:F420-non-reducing hydrogenase small subunit